MDSFGEFLSFLPLLMGPAIALMLVSIVLGLVLSARGFRLFTMIILAPIGVIAFLPTLLLPLLSRTEIQELSEGPGAPSLVLGAGLGVTAFASIWLGRITNAHKIKRFDQCPLSSTNPPARSVNPSPPLKAHPTPNDPSPP